MNFDDIYLVSDKLTTISHDEITALEENLGMPLPYGYREFVTTLGVGTFCGLLRIYEPKRVLSEGRAIQSYLIQDYEDFWDDGLDILSEEDANEGDSL